RLDRYTLPAAPVVAGAIRLELRRNRHFARALCRRDGGFPGPGNRGGAAGGWSEVAGRRHRGGRDWVSVSGSEFERRYAGGRLGSWRDRLEHPAPDRIEPDSRGL